MGALGWWVILAVQEPSVEGILRDFAERMELARTDAESRAAAEKALGELQAYVKADPKAADAARAEFHAAEMLVYLGRTDEAIDRFLSFHRERADDPNRATALFSAAALFEEADRFADARSRYADFAEKHADDPRASTARIRAAMCWLYGGEPGAAIDALKKLADAETTVNRSWEARLALALALHLAERREEAAKRLTEIAQNNPDAAMQAQVGRLVDDFRRIGKGAPDLTVGDFKLADRRGGVVLVHLFSALGDGAVAEAAMLKRTHAKFKDKGFDIVGVCVDGLPESLERYKADHAPAWTVLHDARGMASRAAFGTADPPMALLCDRKGVVRFVYLAGRDLDHAVRKLVEEK